MLDLRTDHYLSALLSALPQAVMRNREQALLQVQEANSEVQQSKERFAAARARSDSPALTLKAQQDLAKVR